jgi:DmsE family decaheme c-type cytochrome
MGRFTRTLGPAATITGAIGLWIAVVVSVSASAAPPSGNRAAKSSNPAASTPAATQQVGYVGEETCLTCHEDKKKNIDKSAHGRSHDPRTPAAGKGCESCHGPGQAHVDGGGDKSKIQNPKTLSPRQASEVCLTCHNRTSHNDFAGGKHDARNVSCVTCHSVHEPKSEKAQLKTTSVTETCVQCHRTQVNKVHKSSHMPVSEGKMECTTCHNPHGSQNVKMLREGSSVVEACTSCHAEKRGPFLWEHAPVRENCTTCHDAHGSNNERMLVAKQPMLCQRCHVGTRHPATVYDATQVTNQSNRIMGRSCVNCHSQIHGSNHPTSGKVFVR